MPAMTKFHDFPEQLLKAVHDLDGTHSLFICLSNVAPNAATNTSFADITEISAGSGYSAGGAAVGVVTLSETGGVAKVLLSDVVVTAAGGSIGPFRYAVLYNGTPTTPIADPVIGYYDNGVSITLASGESYTVDFDDSAGWATFQ